MVKPSTSSLRLQCSVAFTGRLNCNGYKKRRERGTKRRRLSDNGAQDTDTPEEDGEDEEEEEEGEREGILELVTEFKTDRVVGW